MHIYTRCLLYLLVGLSINIIAGTKNIVLCTFYTPSHEPLAKKWLLPSIQDDIPVIIGTAAQECPEATFYKPGWTNTTRKKVQFIIDVLEQHPDHIIIFADADITIFRPIAQELSQLLNNEYDFLAQIDKPTVACSGFFVMKSTPAIKTLWHLVLDIMEQDHTISDQKALNRALKKYAVKLNISWGLLPETYCGGGTFGKRSWKPGQYIRIPKNIALFHANYTPYTYKESFLESVCTIVAQRN